MRPASTWISVARDRWDRLARSALRAIERSPSVRVIIYGEHSPDWMTALAPGAPVWREMLEVGEVLSIPDTAAAEIPEPRHQHVRTVMIPLMEDHTRHCPRRFPSLIPDERAIAVLSDKGAFSTYVAAHGFGDLCPRTYESGAEAVFPCVLKRTDLNGGHGVAVVGSLLDLEARLEQPPWEGRPVILQSLAAGATEYVTHCVCRYGRVLWHCSFAYALDRPDAIRTHDSGEILGPVPTPPLMLSQIEAFLAPLSYSGPCNVDYKLSGEGNIIVFEINPRLGGSLMRPDNVGYLRGALSHTIKAALS